MGTCAARLGMGSFEVGFLLDANAEGVADRGGFVLLREEAVGAPLGPVELFSPGLAGQREFEGQVRGFSNEHTQVSIL